MSTGLGTSDKAGSSLIRMGTLFPGLFGSGCCGVPWTPRIYSASHRLQYEYVNKYADPDYHSLQIDQAGTVSQHEFVDPDYNSLQIEKAGTVPQYESVDPVYSLPAEEAANVPQHEFIDPSYSSLQTGEAVTVPPACLGEPAAFSL